MTIMQTDVPPLFGELSREQANAYLAQFMDEMRASRERWPACFAGAGADPSLADDTSPSALEPIWTAATEAWDLSWQADYVPPPDTAHPAVSRPTMRALGPLEDLPSWFGHDRIHYMRFSPATLWVIDVLGRHLGQCLIEARPQLAWTLGPADGHPEVEGRLDLDPVATGQQHRPEQAGGRDDVDLGEPAASGVWTGLHRHHRHHISGEGTDLARVRRRDDEPGGPLVSPLRRDVGGSRSAVAAAAGTPPVHSVGALKRLVSRSSQEAPSMLVCCRPR